MSFSSGSTSPRASRSARTPAPRSRSRCSPRWSRSDETTARPSTSAPRAARPGSMPGIMPRSPAEANTFVTGLVLGAGGSARLGRPKQLLPYGEGTLLGHVVATARGCGFDQTVVALGGEADAVRRGVDLVGADVVANDAY